MCGLKVVEGCSLQKGWSIMEKRYYIAYGSNLNLRQMKMRCPTAKVMGTAVIKDYELLFKGSLTGAYLTIEPKKGSEVPVAVWTVTEADEEALDRYEGCPVFYYKKGYGTGYQGNTDRKNKKKKMLCVYHARRAENRDSFPFLCKNMP